VFILEEKEHDVFTRVGGDCEGWPRGGHGLVCLASVFSRMAMKEGFFSSVTHSRKIDHLLAKLCTRVARRLATLGHSYGVPANSTIVTRTAA
jgi:hypothetical protein